MQETQPDDPNDWRGFLYAMGAMVLCSTLCCELLMWGSGPITRHFRAKPPTTPVVDHAPPAKTDSEVRTEQYVVEAKKIVQQFSGAVAGLNKATQRLDYSELAQIFTKLGQMQNSLGALSSTNVDPVAVEFVKATIQDLGDWRVFIVDTESVLHSAETVAARRSTPGLIQTVISALLRGAGGDPFGEAADSDSEERALRQRVNAAFEQKQTLQRNEARFQTLGSQLVPTLKQKYPNIDLH